MAGWLPFIVETSILQSLSRVTEKASLLHSRVRFVSGSHELPPITAEQVSMVFYSRKKLISNIECIVAQTQRSQLDHWLGIHRPFCGSKELEVMVMRSLRPRGHHR